VGIVDEDIARVREASDVVAVVSEYTQLRKVGRRYQGLCPFHVERSPSFSLNAEEGLYYCFGCGVRGDIITFVREKELVDFVGAVEMLANRAGITLRYTEVGQSEDRKRKSRLHGVLGQAAEWYHQRLLTGDDAGPARGYLRQRGFDGDAVRRYQIGWAPEGYDQLARALRLSNEDLNESGLGFVNRKGRQQDAFRGRVLFPIFDPTGQALGFGGRILPGGEGPKYKNSAESSVYAKSRILYGLNWAKTDIVSADEVIVCEGYTDVIGFATAGIGRAVATCGTALTEDHVRLLRRFARRVVLAFDADAAGQNAAARFYEWEKAHDLDVAVADLPAGVDPGELALSDPQRLAAAVTGARSFLEFRVDRAIRSVDRSSGEGRARAAEQALVMVAEHPDPLVRDQYVMTVASRCQFEPDLIRSMLRQGPRRAATGWPTSRWGGQQLGDNPELEALRLAVHERDEISGLLVPELFSDELYALVYALVTEAPTMHEVIERGGPEVAEVVYRLLAQEAEASHTSSTLAPLGDPMDVASRLWQRYLERQIERCRRDAREADSGAYALLVEDMKWLRLQLEDLREPERRATAVKGLLAWVLEDSEELS
jgi:DNA primase